MSTNNQFLKEINWLAAEKISTGWPDNTFRPLQPVNRDAMAAFMYRLADEPVYTPPTVSRFKDVRTDNLFYKEISWLASQKISEGWSDGTYRPLQPVNRDAMAAFMYRYAGSPAEVVPTLSLNEQRAVLREKLKGVKQQHIDTRPYISLLARVEGLAVKDSIATATTYLDRASAAVTAATTQPTITAAAKVVDGEVLRASTLKTSAMQLKTLKDLRAVQQTIARAALADLNSGKLSLSAYRATKTRGEAFTTLLATDAPAPLKVIGKIASPAKIQSPAWRDELEARSGSIPTSSGWVGFFGGCALPVAAASFDPKLPASGPAVTTNSKLVAAANTRGTSDPALTAIHAQMLRSASAQAAEVLTIDQLRGGYSERVARLGYGWLQAGDVKAGNALRSDAKKILEAGPESMNTLTSSHLLLAASTAGDWASVTGLDETVLVRWIGPQTCLHADKENFVDGPTNIAAIHNSANFVAAAVYLDNSPLQAAALAKESLVSIQSSLATITSDGGTEEGPGYWTYQSRALATLYSTLPNVYSTSPLAIPSLAKTSHYALNSTDPDGIPTPFADAEPKRLSPLMPAWDAFSRNDRAVAAWVWKELQAKPDAHLMWWYTAPGTLIAKQSAVFPDTGFAALQLPATTATIKGGDNSVSHAHLDIGTVSLFRQGVQWAVDPGTELNNPTGYYSDLTRWNFWKPGTSAHSTLMVGQSNQPIAAKGATKLVSPSSASVDMVQALPGASTATRTVTHSASDMVVNDKVRANNGLPLTWQWVTDASVSVDASANRAVMRKNGQEITLSFGGVPPGSKLTAVTAPGTGPDGKKLIVIKLTMTNVTNLDLAARAS